MANPVADLTGTTVGRFSVRARLGAGGMGEVYRADDTKLKRSVALKRMAPHLRADERYRQRFLKEAERASRLTDQHIAGLYDVLEEGGETFLVMEYVEGETLRQRLQRPLSIEEFLETGVQCGEALVAAHARGLVHRDLKPENIMLTPAGQVKVLDFGVAKRLPRPDETADTAGVDTQRSTGGLSGTPAYMAPETLLEKEADGRADIFSLGIVFYEALTGRHPFLAGGFMATSDRILHEPPAPLTQLNPRIEPELERIVAKMLAKRPEERYQTAADLLVDLRALQCAPQPRPVRPAWRPWAAGVAVTVAAGVLLGLNVAGVRDWLLGRAAPAGIKSLAVLPLKNLSQDPEQDYFADGMTDALITNLTRVGTLRVISRTSVMRYKETQKSLPEIARELNVDAVVEGSVLRVGNRVRINAQLIHAATDRNLWAESYEYELGEVLTLQSQVARAIVEEIRVQLTPQEEAQLARTGPVDPKAYEAYVRGRYHWEKRTEPALKKGLEYFQQAIGIDPAYAMAYAGVADSYVVLGLNGIVPGREAFPKARAAALKALELDPNLAEAHTTLGMVLMAHDWEWQGAEKAFQRAIQLNPGYATAHHWYALHLSALGRHEEAIGRIQQARERDPLSPIINANLAWCLYLARRYDQAIEQARRMLQMDPNFTTAHFYLGQNYVEKRMYEEALAAFDQFLLSSEENVADRAARRQYLQAYVYAASGRQPEAARMMEKLQAELPRTEAPPYDLAMVYATLQDKDRALNFLQQSYEDRDGRLVNLNVHPRFDNLRGDARFQDLLRRMRHPAVKP